jgi:hypothetical protein
MNLGNKIICVDDSLPHPEVLRYFNNWITKDKIYTIRGKRLWYGEYSLLLEEIKNNSMYNPEILGHCEPGYAMKRFRLVDSIDSTINESKEIYELETINN